jgi:hypothetical protein
MEKLEQDSPRGAGEIDFSKEGLPELPKAACAPHVHLQHRTAILEVVNEAERGNIPGLRRVRHVCVGNREGCHGLYSNRKRP